MAHAEELISGLGLTIFFWPRPHSIWPRPHSSLASLTSLAVGSSSFEAHSALQLTFSVMTGLPPQTSSLLR